MYVCSLYLAVWGEGGVCGCVSVWVCVCEFVCVCVYVFVYLRACGRIGRQGGVR